MTNTASRQIYISIKILIDDAIEKANDLNIQLQNPIFTRGLNSYKNDLEDIIKKLNKNIFENLHPNTPKNQLNYLLLTSNAKRIKKRINAITSGDYTSIKNQTQQIFEESVNTILTHFNAANLNQQRINDLVNGIEERFDGLASVATRTTIRRIITGTRGITRDIISISGGDNLVTVHFETSSETTSTLEEPFFIGEPITISGVTPESYNGRFIVLNANASSVSFYMNSKFEKVITDKQGRVVQYRTIFEKILEMANGERRTPTWYRNSLKTIGHRYQHNPKYLFIDERKDALLPIDEQDKNELRKFPKEGNMFFFEYDATYKERLPYYDMFPLVYMIKVTGNHFYAANLHYIEPRRRIPIINKLKKSQILTVPYACVNKYDKDNVLIKVGSFGYLQLDPHEWETAIFLPVEKFVRTRDSRQTQIDSSIVWRETNSGGPRNRDGIPKRRGTFNKEIVTKRYGLVNR
jgi:hypothetical protein